METRTIITQEDATRLAETLVGLPLPLTVTWCEKGETRSARQNRTIHLWIGEIEKATEGQSFDEIKAHCNLTYGRPILSRDDAEWASAFDYIFESLSHAAKLKAIRVFDVPFTRRMTVKQLSEYMDQMMRDYAEAGIILTDPELRG